MDNIFLPIQQSNNRFWSAKKKIVDFKSLADWLRKLYNHIMHKLKLHTTPFYGCGYESQTIPLIETEFRSTHPKYPKSYSHSLKLN
jgi:hypothetical protein